MKDDNHSFGKESAWYPWHVSDRADELIDELDEAQLRRLFDALKTKSIPEWFVWLEDARKEISEYDWLSPSERKHRLQDVASHQALLLHHASVFVELWRARTHSKYFHLPPNGPPLNTPESQREMMLGILASYSAYDMRDLWPFELPDGESQLPFRESEL